MSLGAAIKAPSAWKCGITDELLQGPVAWPFSQRFTTQAVNHTPHSHPFFKCFPAFQSQHLTHNLLLYQFSQPPSLMCHQLISVTVALFFFPLTSRKVNGTGECWFVFSGDWDLGIYGTYEKHLTKRGTDSKNTETLSLGH